MRVIAGSARRLNLVAPESKVRPTTDRTKETLFNIISDELPKAIVLDLFAGSGSLGIEALSRGAQFCYFSDDYKKSIECIKKNLQHTKLVEKAKVFMYDYGKTLDTLSREEKKFHVIFLDPPYNKGLEQEALDKIVALELLAEDGIIVIESDVFVTLNMDKLPGYVIYKEKEYKTNKFTFIQKEVD